MHLLKTISHGCGKNRKDILQFKQASSALQTSLRSTNNTVALPLFVCLLARRDIATHALQACSSTQNRYFQQVDYCIKSLLVSCVCFCEVLLACNDDCSVCTTSEWGQTEPVECRIFYTLAPSLVDPSVWNSSKQWRHLPPHTSQKGRIRSQHVQRT